MPLRGPCRARKGIWLDKGLFFLSRLLADQQGLGLCMYLPQSRVNRARANANRHVTCI